MAGKSEDAAFRARWPQCRALRASILDSGLDDDAFDCVVVVGGLHHVQPHVSAAVGEIHRILRPGGFFCFAEPHGGSLPDLVRRFWYRHDRLFETNQAAIDLGNVAYLLVFSSMVFRIPLWLKPLYSSPVMACEAVLRRGAGPPPPPHHHLPRGGSARLCTARALAQARPGLLCYGPLSPTVAP